MRPPSRPNPWFCEPVSHFVALHCWIFLHSSCISYSETRKTYRAILSEPRIVVPILSCEPAQPTTTEPSTAAAQAHAQSSTTDGPPVTEPSTATPQSVAKSQHGHSATKKRRREPDSDTGPAATTERAKATTAAPAVHDVTDGAPARKKKKKKKDGVVQK
jgi:ribonuclease P/MRP protein subunit RPP1